MDSGARGVTVHGVTKSWSQRVGHNGVTFTFTCLPILGRGNVPQSDSVSISHKLVLKKKKRLIHIKPIQAY